MQAAIIMPFKFPPDVQAHLDASRAYANEKKTAARMMTNDTLFASIHLALRNMPEAYRYSAGDCVYNGQFYHVLLPELMKRCGAPPTHDEFRQMKAANDSPDDCVDNDDLGELQ